MPATHPPDPSASHIVRFCATIVPDARPRLMRIVPSAGAVPLECFSNARREAEAHGGRIQFGWSIWEWPGVFVEAEHHAVYAPPGDAAWVDVTPAPDGETQRMFLPDDAATCDFPDEAVGRASHRLPLVTDPLVEQLFEIAALENQIRASIPGTGTVYVPERIAVGLERLSQTKALIVNQIGMKYTRRNQPCFCGRGEKFKRCCGR